MATQQSFSPLQKLFAPDLTNLAYNSRYGVKSGCKVIESPVPAMSVRAQAGQVYFDAATVTVAQQDLVVTAADPSYDRYDLVLVDTGGICTVLAGTAAAAPVTPVYNADNYTCLAIVFVQQAVTTIVNANIRDSRSLNFRAQTGLNFITFINQTSINVVHNFGSYPEVQVVDNTGNVIDPQGILHNTINDFTVTLGSSTSGTIIYSGGAIALIDSSKVSKNGDAMVGNLGSQTVYPNNDNQYDLGTSLLKYRNLFVGTNATIVGTATVGTAATTNTTVATKLTIPAGADPGSPAVGQLWLNTTTNEVKDYDGANIRILANKEELYGAFDSIQQLILAATDVDSSSAYTTTKKYHVLKNTGANKCYVQLDAASTTAAGYDIAPGQSYEHFGLVNTWHVICDTGKTSTLRIIGQGDSTLTTPAGSSQSLAVTNVNGSVGVFGGATLVNIQNTGSKSCYVNLDAAATTNHALLQPGEVLALGKRGLATVQAICGGSDTTTLKVISVARY